MRCLVAGHTIRCRGQVSMGWDDFLILTKPEVSDAVTQAFEKSFLGAPVDQAFKEADAKINKILAEEVRE